MFGLFRKKPTGEKIVFHIDGMHCVSCSMNIDGALEDVAGVHESSTQYAGGITTVLYDPQKTNQQALKKIIESTGYLIKDSTMI